MNWRNGIALSLVPALALFALAGCLSEPEIDERWTKLEFLAADPVPGTAAPAGQSIDVTVTGRITYRDILTGFVVAEVRYSDTVSPTDVALNPALHTLNEAGGVDRILANSVTAGRATRAVTGFDHLMQDFTLSFTAQGWPDSVAGSGLFLVFYMGEGEEIELQDGTDSLVVTPFVSTDYEVLHTGFALDISPPGGGSVP
jgi:hypothetical protein